MTNAEKNPADLLIAGSHWLTEAQTAHRLNMSKKWLQKERLRGGPLRFAKFGSAVRYLLSDIEQFERDSVRSSTADPGSPSCGAGK